MTVVNPLPDELQKNTAYWGIVMGKFVWNANYYRPYRPRSSPLMANHRHQPRPRWHGEGKCDPSVQRYGYWYWEVCALFHRSPIGRQY
jgi:hypothetical protein